MSITETLRKNVEKIAQRNLAGESLDSIAAKYGCTRWLVIRVMRQKLPEEFWMEKARRRSRIAKAKETGKK